MNTSEPYSTKDKSWTFVVLLFSPFFLSLLAGFFDFHLSTSLNIAIHYTIYLIGFGFVVAYFFMKGYKKSTQFIEEWFPVIIAFTATWDIITPLSNVASFSLLKTLFYILVVFEVPHLIFGNAKIFPKANSQYPLIILLVVVAIFYFNQGFYIESSGLEEVPFFTTIINKQFLSFVVLVGMLGLAVALLFKPNLLSSFSKPIIYISGLLAILLATNHFLSELPNIARNINSNANWASRFHDLAFPIDLPVLFLFLLVVVLFDESLSIELKGWSFKPRVFLGLSFGFTFMLLYIVNNQGDIGTAIQEVLKYRNTIGNWVDYVVVGLAIITSMMTLVEFRNQGKTVKQE